MDTSHKRERIAASHQLVDIRAKAGTQVLVNQPRVVFPFSVALQSVEFGVYRQAMVLKPSKTKILLRALKAWHKASIIHL